VLAAERIDEPCPVNIATGTEVSVAEVARTVAALTLCSRLSGLARDALWSRVFSAGDTLSAFVVAFAIPNLFRRLFGEGALAAAFVPEYARLHQKDPAMAARYASAMVALLAVSLGALAILGEGVLALLLLATPLVFVRARRWYRGWRTPPRP